VGCATVIRFAHSPIRVLWVGIGVDLPSPDEHNHIDPTLPQSYNALSFVAETMAAEGSNMAMGLCPDNLNISHPIFGPSWAAPQSRNPLRRRALRLRFRSIVASQSDPNLSGICTPYFFAGPCPRVGLVQGSMLASCLLHHAHNLTRLGLAFRG
jgi:hypothetical protein